MTHTSELENLLSAVTDALLAEQGDLDAVISQYNVPRTNVDLFVKVIRRLHMTLVGVQPSRRFVRRLKADLMGLPHYSVVSRVRFLPARVQIAAGLAVIAGFMLLTRRRLMVDVQEAQEAPALQ
jgi:hypothetical protein